MTEEQNALARRAVACRGWRWMPGMLLTTGLRLRYGGYAFSHDTIPDLSDPATLGCLLALVREAHAVPFLQVSVKISREHGYRFECNPRHRGAWVESEEEALVVALEAAQ